MKRWVINVLLGIDQLANAILLGDPDETISSRIGKTKRRNFGVIPWHRYPIRFIVDKLLDWLDPGHSIGAIEEDEGHGFDGDYRGG